MVQILNGVQWCIANYQVVVSGVGGVVASLIVLCAVIPGEQPEKALHGFADFIAKFSKK